MGNYIPHEEVETEELVGATGADSVEALFASIPKEICFDKVPDIESAGTEQGLFDRMSAMAAKNTVAGGGSGWSCFLGSGCYNHYVPAAVDAIAGRSEYYTSYTPYQPELSQGSLQAGFEFQSLIANLYGVDVANASMYDGANALQESILMARRIGKNRGKVAISKALHPEYRQVVETYAKHLFETVEVPFDPVTGKTDYAKIQSQDDLCAVAVQHPNYFGVLEDLDAFTGFAAAKQAVSIVSNNEPVAFGALRAPGSYGVEIIAAEGQSLGNPVNFGGPHLGIIGTAKKFLRQLPGRLVGETVDAAGRRSFVLTLATREQHIRRERATSNICTNQFLLALRAAVYMGFVGAAGLRHLAFENAKRQSLLDNLVGKAKHVKKHFSAPTFNECVLDLGQVAASKALAVLEGERIIGGQSLEAVGLPNHLLVAVTEMNAMEDIERFVTILDKVAG